MAQFWFETQIDAGYIPIVEFEGSEARRAAESRVQGKLHHWDFLAPVMLVRMDEGLEDLSHRAYCAF
jgi:hypothetical protein